MYKYDFNTFRHPQIYTIQEKLHPELFNGKSTEEISQIYFTSEDKYIKDDAVAKLLLRFEPLLGYYYFHYSNQLDLEDIRGHYITSFVRALRKFDPKGKTLFQTFFKFILDNEMRTLITITQSNKRRANRNTINLILEENDGIDMFENLPSEEESIEDRVESKIFLQDLYDKLDNALEKYYLKLFLEKGLAKRLEVKSHIESQFKIKFTNNKFNEMKLNLKNKILELKKEC